MIAVFGLVLGAITGWSVAKRRNGNGFDKAQYASVFGIIFFILGWFITVMIHRMF